jgi:catechol 2,3-dioxygenase-like lactoylglutathione lyase family enzyme
MLKARRVLETAVYCDDLSRTADFYRALLALEPMSATERVVSFDAGEGTILLLFQRGVCDQPSRGGHSIYFSDPDGRSVELATPGIWPCY